MESKTALGLDFGTDSVRALLLDLESGEEVATGTEDYPRFRKGHYNDAVTHRYRQHPLDHAEAMENAVKSCLRQAGNRRGDIQAIGIDTTGSTPAPVDASGRPLALHPEFREDPDAMFVLWKDHTAVAEAEEITALSKNWNEDYTAFSGGVYSSEWFFAKMLHIVRKNPQVAAHAHTWVEHCDWIPALLCGNATPETWKRSRCAAGHKALWHARWGGLPPQEFFDALDPRLKGIRKRLFTDTHTSDRVFGQLSAEWAFRLGLESGLPVAVGAFDAHLGAVGAGIKSNVLCKVIGTSTCDIVAAESGALSPEPVAGICGQVDGSVLPGMVGLEAGQSAFGDIFAWFRKLLEWPLSDSAEGSAVSGSLLGRLEKAAMELAPLPEGPLALDWFNGRRTPFANARVRAAWMGLDLSSSPPMLYRSLVESACFGAKAILETFEGAHVPIHKVLALGGVSHKSPLTMQILADVLARPIEVSAPGETCARGAALMAAVAAGAFPDCASAVERLAAPIHERYHPDADLAPLYQSRYREYQRLASFIDRAGPL